MESRGEWGEGVNGVNGVVRSSAAAALASSTRCFDLVSLWLSEGANTDRASGWQPRLHAVAACQGSRLCSEPVALPLSSCPFHFLPHVQELVFIPAHSLDLPYFSFFSLS